MRLPKVGELGSKEMLFITSWLNHLHQNGALEEYTCHFLDVFFKHIFQNISRKDGTLDISSHLIIFFLPHHKPPKPNHNPPPKSPKFPKKPPPGALQLLGFPLRPFVPERAPHLRGRAARNALRDPADGALDSFVWVGVT